MSGGANAQTGAAVLYDYNLGTVATGLRGYDPAGNVTALQDPVMGTWKFTYDSLNRLTSATGLGGSFNGINVAAAIQGWGYDSFGNRTFQGGGTAPTPTEWADYQPTSNIMAENNYAPGGLPIAPDADGRLLSDGINNYRWEAQGRLCGITTAPGVPELTSYYRYVYDPSGNLVTSGSQSGPGCSATFTTMADFVLDQNGRKVSQTTNTGAWQNTNVYANGELLVTYTAAGLHFALNDWLGTKRVQVSNSGAVEETCWNLPFNDGFGCAESAGGSDATDVHYTGKQHDPNTKLDLFGAREYANYSGRFLSPDTQDDETNPEPVPWADFQNPQSLNQYSYVYNNPLSHTDSDGHDVNVCTTLNGTQQCQQISNEQYQAGQQGNNGGLNVPSLDSVGTNGSGNITDASGNTVGTATYVSNGNLDPFTQAQGFATLGAASRVVNAVGAVELGALSVAMPELLADSAIEAGLTGGAKLGEAAANRINHVFQAKHKLDVLVQQFGGKQGAYEAIASAAERAVAGTAGPFQTTVQVGGQSVVVRGAVIDGIVKISTAFGP
jgi:RHS repeat-associated protein